MPTKIKREGRRRFQVRVNRIIEQSDQGLNIKVKEYKLTTDPPVLIWEIELYNKEGSWSETFTSKEGVGIFIKGLEAGYGFAASKYLRTPHLS